MSRVTFWSEHLGRELPKIEPTPGKIIPRATNTIDATKAINMPKNIFMEILLYEVRETLKKPQDLRTLRLNCCLKDIAKT